MLNTNDDCLLSYFEISSLKEIITLGETCTKMQKKAGEYLQKNLLRKVFCRDGNFYTNINRKNVSLEYFTSFIQNVNVHDLQFFQSNQFEPHFKEIIFYNTDYEATNLIEPVFHGVESLKFISIKAVDINVYEKILQHCENLKDLYFEDDNLHRGEKYEQFIFGTSNSWLTKHYPSLEHFGLNSKRKSNEIIEFLKLNRNITKFTTSDTFLMKNQDALLESEIELDTLLILHMTPMNDSDYSNFHNILATLQTRNIFKNLHLYFNDWMGMASLGTYPTNLLQFVTVLYRKHNNFALSGTINLEELYIYKKSDCPDLSENQVLDNLKNLKFIQMYSATMNDILPFIQRLPELQALKVKTLESGQYFNSKNGLIDLKGLNDERAHCPNGRKITIYVDEKIYLPTKTLYNSNVFKFIDIKRLESLENSLYLDHTF